MKIDFKFGYIHLLKWLIKYKIDVSIGTNWDQIADQYNMYWRIKDGPDLLMPAAEKIVRSLKKL